jgi:Rrf2 family protein
MALYGAPVEYALHTLLNLCLGPDDAAPSAKDLAEFQKLPVPFMRKQLTQLEKAGLVKGSKGIRGGWRLARDAAAISVLDVADAAQGGRPKVFDCKDIRSRCALWPDASPPANAVEGVCEIHAVMLAAEQEMRMRLAACSVADIAERVMAKTGETAAIAIRGWFKDRHASRRENKRGSKDG